MGADSLLYQIKTNGNGYVAKGDVCNLNMGGHLFLTEWNLPSEYTNINANNTRTLTYCTFLDLITCCVYVIIH